MVVKKIVGYDDHGNKVFEREARAYDKSIANEVFGISIGDIIKAGSVLIVAVMCYANQQNINAQMLRATSENSQAIGGIKDALGNLNNYLSSTTGKQFRDGRPQ